MQQRLPIDDPSQVAAARRVANRLAAEVGFGPVDQGRAALIATELATNLTKHALSGELLIRPMHEPPGVELLAIDRGPGMGNPEAYLRDGFSTTGSAGTGLGAIRRIADEFDIHSQPGAGTELVARLYLGSVAPAPLEVGLINLPYPGETACGDAWAVQHVNGRSRILLVDGIGHGVLAAQAAGVAVDSFLATPEAAPTEALDTAHAALRATRGAAAAAVELDRGCGRLRYAGIGNICAVIVRPHSSRALMSHNGTLGHEMRKLQEVSESWTNADLLIMHSDGMGTRWNLDDLPGLRVRDPALVAAALYRGFVRGRDDVTVLAARTRVAR